MVCNYEKKSIKEEVLLNKNIIEKDTVLKREAGNGFKCDDTGPTSEEEIIALHNVIEKLRY